MQQQRRRVLLRVARRVKSISLWTGSSSTASGRASHLIAFFGKSHLFWQGAAGHRPLVAPNGCVRDVKMLRDMLPWDSCKKGVHQISIGPYKRPQTPSVISVQSIPLVYLFLWFDLSLKQIFTFDFSLCPGSRSSEWSFSLRLQYQNDTTIYCQHDFRHLSH